jgi:hypothetical protein
VKLTLLIGEKKTDGLNKKSSKMTFGAFAFLSIDSL